MLSKQFYEDSLRTDIKKVLKNYEKIMEKQFPRDTDSLTIVKEIRKCL